MYPALRSSGILALLALARPLAAQCPDGTPPPCRAATTTAVPARVAIDQNLIAVFPFRVTGSATDAASLREGAMDLLGLALDEQAGLRVVASRTLLARARNFNDATSVADAAAIARGLGAGAMILGNAVIVGSQVRARADLHDLVHSQAVTSVEARGLSADPAPMIDSLAAGLARLRLAGTGTLRRSLQELSSTSPAALSAYVAAEQLSRQGHWREAATSLQSAIRIDSTFGLAYYRLSVAGRYGGGGSVGDEVTTALRFQGRLPRRQRDLLHSVLATQRGDLRDAIAQADAIAAAYPDDPEVAFEQGEAYFHIAAGLGEPTTQAERAWARAIALDSNMIEPYNHLEELLLLGGDTATAVHLMQHATALAPTTAITQAMMITLRTIRGERPAASVGSTPLTPELLTRIELETSRLLTGDPARAVGLIEQFYALVGPDASRADREGAVLRRVDLLSARGRFAEAAALARSSGTPPGDLAAARVNLNAAMLGGHAGEPSSSAVLDSSNAGSLVYSAWYALARQDTAAANSAAGLLRRLPAPQDAFGSALASCIDARQSLARGDSSQARAQLARIAVVKPFATISEFAYGCITLLARLERAAGDLETPYRQLGAANYLNGVIISRAGMEELRAQIAEQRGDTTGAVRGYRMFVGLWENADPEFQPRVAAARAALARLSSGR